MSTSFFDLNETKEGSDWERLSASELYGDEGWVQAGSSRMVIPKRFLSCHEKIENLKVRDDDVWIISFPKSGTTIVQEMAWCIMNNFDIETALKIPLPKRSPFLDMEATYPPHLLRKLNAPTIEELESFPSPRCLPIHFQLEFLPKDLRDGTTKAKMIYVARDPKDVFVSYYKYIRDFDGYRGTMEQCVDQFVTNNVLFAPYWTHLNDFSKLKGTRKDIIWITYEEIRQVRTQLRILFLHYFQLPNTGPAVIRKTADFLSKPYTQAQVEHLADHLSFEKMKSNPAVNRDRGLQIFRKLHGNTFDPNFCFIRKGKVGGWKEELPEMIAAKLDLWIQSNN